MNPFMLILGAIGTAIQVAEFLMSEKGQGKKKKKAVVDSVSATIKQGVDSGVLRGSWDQMTPEVIGTLVEVIGSAQGVFSQVSSKLEGVNQP